jgi:8-amino-3,8-dideoxy-alpha-D-manno-octulosonate transaminase
MNNESLPRGRDTHRIHGFNYRMTEIQAVIAKVQLGKLDYIVKKNRENYSIIESALLEIKGLKLRKVPNQCKPLCDTLIIQFDSKDMADELVVGMQNEGLGTKNVPDAIEWHFAKYWDHMLDFIEMNKTGLEKSLSVSNEIIERCVALPIFVSTVRQDTFIMAKKIKILINEVMTNHE